MLRLLILVPVLPLVPLPDLTLRLLALIVILLLDTLSLPLVLRSLPHLSLVGGTVTKQREDRLGLVFGLGHNIIQHLLMEEAFRHRV